MHRLISNVEGRCTDQDGGFVLSGFADRLSVHRIGVVNGAKADHERKPQRDAETEGVKEREDAHDFVAWGEMDHLANAFDVGEYVVMGQHDTLGGSRAAAREYDRR